jgi:hypothetical protein
MTVNAAYPIQVRQPCLQTSVLSRVCAQEVNLIAYLLTR